MKDFPSITTGNGQRKEACLTAGGLVAWIESSGERRGREANNSGIVVVRQQIY